MTTPTVKPKSILATADEARTWAAMPVGATGEFRRRIDHPRLATIDDTQPQPWPVFVGKGKMVDWFGRKAPNSFTLLPPPFQLNAPLFARLANIWLTPTAVRVVRDGNDYYWTYTSTKTERP